MYDTIRHATVTPQSITALAVQHTAAAKAAPTRAEAAPHLEAAGQYIDLLMNMGVTAEQFTALVATARGGTR